MDYVLIVKTGEAELRALEMTSEQTKKHFIPLIELTRGRKIRNADEREVREIYPFDRRLQRIENVFEGCSVMLDLTSNDVLSNQQINALYDAQNGYDAWVSFLIDLKQRSCFRDIFPCLIVDANDEHLKDNIVLETRKLLHEFGTVVYRSDIMDEGCYIDLPLIKDEFLSDNKFYFLIDCGYVNPIKIKDFQEKVNARITNVKPLLPSNSEIIVSATSFPNSISEMADAKHDVLPLGEVNLHSGIKEPVIYSDYGCINPERNDMIVMARGWVPHIDVPLDKSVYYYRERRPNKNAAYADTYKNVAKTVVGDVLFPTKLEDNWGIKQIKYCAYNSPSSCSPSHWISVRMCIHIETQVERIQNLKR